MLHHEPYFVHGFVVFERDGVFLGTGMLQQPFEILADHRHVLFPVGQHVGQVFAGGNLVARQLRAVSEVGGAGAVDPFPVTRSVTP